MFVCFLSVLCLGKNFSKVAYDIIFEDKQVGLNELGLIVLGFSTTFMFVMLFHALMRPVSRARFVFFEVLCCFLFYFCQANVFSQSLCLALKSEVGDETCMRLERTWARWGLEGSSSNIPHEAGQQEQDKSNNN